MSTLDARFFIRCELCEISAFYGVLAAVLSTKGYCKAEDSFEGLYLSLFIDFLVGDFLSASYLAVSGRNEVETGDLRPKWLSGDLNPPPNFTFLIGVWLKLET